MNHNSTKAPLLAVNKLGVNLCVTAATPIVSELSFSIERGETLVLLGESGSGKSVTGLSIIRLLPEALAITDGSILLDGTDLIQLPESKMRTMRGRRIAMIFQDPHTALNPVLTCGLQIGEVLTQHYRLRGSKLHQRVIELLAAVGFSEAKTIVDRYPHQLSGGMKQRVMIAIALAGDPDLLIADEPTTALDVTIQATILELLQSIQDRFNMGMLFITHNLAVAKQMGQSIAVMRHGRILEKTDTASLFRSPSSPYTKELFAAFPETKNSQKKSNSVPISVESQVLLNVSDLKVYFPVRKGLLQRIVSYVKAVDGASITLSENETLGIVGESGSGKSTLGLAILRLAPTYHGSIQFSGIHLTELTNRQMLRHRKNIQIIFQDSHSAMNPRMRIKEIIEEGMRAQHIFKTADERTHRVDELLEQVGLDSASQWRYPHEFSGGQRQRICIARALAVNPKLIICDEPTSSLDVSVQAQILDLLIDLQNRLGLAYLFISHDIGVVQYMAHRVAVMYQGHIVEHGEVDSVLKNPNHQYTQSLLAAVPHI